MTKVRFKNVEFLFIGDKDRKTGGLASQEQFDNFEPGFAHLYADGVIRRYGVPIGTREDLEFLDD
jgi:hypothetical protein